MKDICDITLFDIKRMSIYRGASDVLCTKGYINGGVCIGMKYKKLQRQQEQTGVVVAQR